MHAFKVVAALLVGVAALHITDAASNTPKCTAEVTEKYDENFSFDCSNILEDFKTCSDDCLATFKNLIQYSPTDCTSTIQGDPSMRERTERKIKDCEAVRANAASRYIPQLSPGAEECSTVQTRPWDDKYGSTGKPNQKCSFNARVGEPCSDDCLKLIEEGIQAAPMCRLSVTTNLTSFEYEKRGLVSCLTVRGGSVKTNTVLLSTTNKNGESTVEKTTEPTSTPTPTPTPTPTSTPTIGSTLTTVAPSAELTSSTPTPTATSSTSSLSVSLAAAVSSVVVAMVATL